MQLAIKFKVKYLCKRTTNEINAVHESLNMALVQFDKQPETSVTLTMAQVSDVNCQTYQMTVSKITHS